MYRHIRPQKSGVIRFFSIHIALAIYLCVSFLNAFERKGKKTFDAATLKTPGPFCFLNKLMNEGILALGSENCCSNDSVPCLMPLTITGVLVSVAIGTLLATFFVSQGFVVSAHECQKKSSLNPPRRPLC